MSGATSLHSRCTQFFRALATDSTSSSAPTLADQLTEPVEVTQGGTDGLIDIGRSKFVPTNIVVTPYGTGSDNTTGTVYIIGWQDIADPTLQSNTTQWHPSILAEFDFTLCSMTGVANGLVDNSHRYADTIATPTVGTPGQDCRYTSPQDNTPAVFVGNISGFQKIQLAFKVGTATALNAIVKWY